MGTCTVAIKKRTGIAAACAAHIVDITMSASYATGGDTVPLAALGLTTCDALILCGDATGYACEAVHGATPNVAPKIRLWEDKATAAATPLLEEAAAVNVSTTVIRALVIGDSPFI